MEEEKHHCPDRPAGPHPFKLPNHDTWTVEADGTRTCSYCGSLHEEDFLQICGEYVAGTPGYRFGSTTKGYKFYANRPGVQNASQGGIKFYNWHVDRTDPAELDRKSKIVGAALRAEAETLSRMYSGS